MYHSMLPTMEREEMGETLVLPLLPPGMEEVPVVFLQCSDANKFTTVVVVNLLIGIPSQQQLIDCQRH